MRYAFGLTLVLLQIPAMALAQSPFDGVWELDISASPPPTTHYDYLLNSGTFRCASCDPPFEIPADGRDHALTGDPCIETASVTVADAYTLEEIDKRNGKTVGTMRLSVSPDRTTAIQDWTENCNEKGDIVSGKDELTRIADGPQGSHAVSGSWKLSKRLSRSTNAQVITLRLTDEAFTFADPAGQKYTARLDGTEAKFEGGVSQVLVSVKRTARDTVEETDKRDGTIVRTTRFVVSPDGKTLTVSMADAATGTSTVFVARKRPSPPAVVR
jgi:hypothetical protein